MTVNHLIPESKDNKKTEGGNKNHSDPLWACVFEDSVSVIAFYQISV